MGELACFVTRNEGYHFGLQHVLMLRYIKSFDGQFPIQTATHSYILKGMNIMKDQYQNISFLRVYSRVELIDMNSMLSRKQLVSSSTVKEFN